MKEPGGRIELRQRLLSNNRTEGKLLLKKQLDFETEPWFTFTLLAMVSQTFSFSFLCCMLRLRLILILSTIQTILTFDDISFRNLYLNLFPSSSWFWPGLIDL